MLETIINRIGERANRIPTRQDIAELLGSVGAPGRKRGTKDQQVARLFDRLRASHLNAVSGQSFSALDDLSSYPEY